MQASVLVALVVIALAVAVVDRESRPSLVAADDCPLGLGDCSGVETTLPEITTTTTNLTPTSTTSIPLEVLTKSSGSLRLEVRLEPPSLVAGEILRIHVRATDVAGSFIAGGTDYGDGSGGSRPGVPNIECGETPFTVAGPSAEETSTLEYTYRVPGRYPIRLFAASADCSSDEGREVEVSTIVDVGEGVLLGNGPITPRLSLKQLPPVDNEDPDAVVLNISGRDRDGWVRRIVVDWGDGAPTWVYDRPLSECTDPITRFPGPSDVTRAELHRYPAAGPFTVTATLDTTACDGSNVQTVTRQLIVSAP